MLEDLTVVVVTDAKGPEVQTAIKAIASELLDAERILVIQGPDVEARRCLAAVGTAEGFQIVRDLAFGAARARNLGASFSTKRSVLFLDDDVEVCRDVIEEALERFNSSESGMLALYGSSASGPSITSRVGVGVYFESIRRVDTFDMIWEGALLVQKAILQVIDFDERLGTGASTIWGADEGPDLAIRLIDEGFKVAVARDLHVRHLDDIEEGCLAITRRSWRYSVGRGGVARRHHLGWQRLYRDFFRPIGGLVRAIVHLDGRGVLRYSGRSAGFCVGWIRWPS